MSENLRYANKAVIKNNPVASLLYLIALPIALCLQKLKINPNTVTYFSVALTLVAICGLAYKKLAIFFIFWFIAYLLDFVDGTLARLSGKIGKTALCIDHVLDLIKISMLLFGFSLYYTQSPLNELFFISAVLYLFYTVLNHEENWIKLHIKMQRNICDDNDFMIKENFSTLKNFLKNKPKLKSLINYPATLITINAHTLIIFFFIPINSTLATTLMSYFVGILTLQSFLRMKSLNSLPKLESLSKII